MTVDREKERSRLAELYAGKTDDEIEIVAKQTDALTEIAREVLRDELARRQMSPGQSRELVGTEQDEADYRDLVPIRSYWGLLDAELARGALEAQGIDAFLFDDNMVRMDWFNANALGGVKLRVDRQNVQEANRVLEEAELQSSDAALPEEPDSPV